MTTPLRIVFVLPAMAGGGAERVVLQLLRRLDRTAFTPSLVLLDRSGELLSEIPPDVPIADCGRRGANRGLAWSGVLARTLHDARPGLIVSFLWATNLAAIVARSRAKLAAPLILCERLSLDGTSEGWMRTLIRRAGTYVLYRRAECVTANSVALARRLERAAGLPPGRVVAMSNPVDHDELRANAADPAGMPETASSWPRPWTVGMGRLHRQKGFDALIRAFAASGVAGTLVLIGEGPERQSLGTAAARAGVASRVAFAGFLANPHTLLAKADIFVLSSRYEGFPNALVEAMALGRACVATRCPTGPEEIVDDERCGLLVPVDDEAALGRAIVRLADDPGLAARLGGAARERVAAYEAGDAVRRFEALFLETATR